MVGSHIMLAHGSINPGGHIPSPVPSHLLASVKVDWSGAQTAGVQTVFES